MGNGELTRGIDWLLLSLLLLLTVLYYKWSRKEFSLLPSPGASLPLIGHYKIFTHGSDPATLIWDLYRKYSSNGMMLLNVFGLNQMCRTEDTMIIENVEWLTKFPLTAELIQDPLLVLP